VGVEVEGGGRGQRRKGATVECGTKGEVGNGGGIDKGKWRLEGEGIENMSRTGRGGEKGGTRKRGNRIEKKKEWRGLAGRGTRVLIEGQVTEKGLHEQKKC